MVSEASKNLELTRPLATQMNIEDVQAKGKDFFVNKAFTEKNLTQQERFKLVVEGGISQALNEIQQDFEDTPDNRLSFHNTKHTKDVIRRTQQIMEALQRARAEDPNTTQITDEDILLAMVTSAFHDRIQKYDATEQKDKPFVDENGVGHTFDRTFRVRHTTTNEEASAAELIKYMDTINEQCTQQGIQTMFTDDHKKTVMAAMDATIPGWDGNLKTVVQTKINPDPKGIVIATALSDLGTAGMDGADAYKKEGPAIFMEENLDCAKDFQNLTTIPENKKQEYRIRMIDWLRSQIQFATGREILFNQTLSTFKLHEQAELKKLFPQFTESIEAVTKRYEQNQNASFETLARLFTGKIPLELKVDNTRAALEQIAA